MNPRPADGSRIERIAVPILLAVAALALGVRATAIAQPLGIDQSLWASAARGMARGQLLYRDVWEQRPPGIYLTYLSAFSVLGWREATLAWLDLVASALTTVAIYGVARVLSTRLTAATAAAFYAVFTLPAWLYGYGGFLERSVCETFTVACASAAAWAAARLHGGSKRPTLLAGFVGLAIGVAVVYKPNAGLYLPAIALWLLFYWPAPPGAAWRGRGLLIASLAISAAIPAVLTVAWLWSVGVLGDARVAVFDFNRFYLTTGVTIDALGLAFAKAVWLRMKTDPLWAAGGIGALLAVGTFVRERRLAPLPALLVCWGGAAALVILVNGIRLFNAYFMNALAPLALMSAWVITDRRTGTRAERLVAGATAVLMVTLLIGRGFVPRVVDAASADLSVLAGRLPRVEYLERFGGYANNRGYSARANEELAAYVAAHTALDEKVFLFGINGAGLYFLADRLTAHRFLRVNFFVPEAFPNPLFTRAAVVGDLERVKPRYVIFERLHTASEVGRQIDALPEHPDVAAWLATYELETRIEDFSVFRRR